MSHWVEVGDGVFARRHDELDLTTGLVVGDGACLVIDTAGDTADGAALADAVRGITAAPWTVVYTHAHFDHCFGTAAFGTTGGAALDVWAHDACRAALATTGEAQRAHWAAHHDDAGLPAAAAALRSSPLVPPTRTFTRNHRLDVGGRGVVLAHLGRGHTDHDVVVHVPDADVVFAGDLVEHGAPPAFEDAFPLEWPAAVRRLLDLAPRVVVPGHGDPVGPAFVRRQHDELAAIAGLCARAARGDAVDVTASPYPAEVTRIALARPG